MKVRTAKRIRAVGGILFLIYMILLIYFLFFAESYGRGGAGEYRYNLIPLREINRFIRYPDVLGMRAVIVNLAGNVIGFLPFGAILPVLRKPMRSLWKITLLSFEFSAAIEVMQLITRVGSFDVDDIILNTAGGILGYLIFALCNRLRRRYYG
ncbi:MAG: VanZ family protein [Lachnospiraceae bacterium]|nr:VanZ family protein [Lachnospiraceae bacterium]MDD3795232.1 VanZ family protein [Lachnospiraceae bacterium]